MKLILLVDDLADVRELVSDFLSIQGYRVIEACDGKNALEKFAQNLFDAAIVDIQMPVMDGLQFSRKALQQRPEFPIILITGFKDRYTESDFKSSGARFVVQKPIDLSELANRLHQVLETQV
jgi:CheY-like chemotaxis protein